jgi:hypothetical protein
VRRVQDLTRCPRPVRLYLCRRSRRRTPVGKIVTSRTAGVVRFSTDTACDIIEGRATNAADPDLLRRLCHRQQRPPSAASRRGHLLITSEGLPCDSITCTTVRSAECPPAPLPSSSAVRWHRPATSAQASSEPVSAQCEHGEEATRHGLLTGTVCLARGGAGQDCSGVGRDDGACSPEVRMYHRDSHGRRFCDLRCWSECNITRM